MTNVPLIKSLLLVAFLLNLALATNFIVIPKLRQHLAITIFSTNDKISYEEAKNIADEYYPQL